MDEKLALIKKAIESGAKITLGFYRSDSRTRAEAEALAQEVMNAGGYEIEECLSEDRTRTWLRVSGDIHASIFYSLSKEELLLVKMKQIEENQRQLNKMQRELDEMQV